MAGERRSEEAAIVRKVRRVTDKHAPRSILGSVLLTGGEEVGKAVAGQQNEQDKVFQDPNFDWLQAIYLGAEI